MMKNINVDTEKHIISWQDPVGLTTTLQGILLETCKRLRYNIIVRLTFCGSRNMLILTKGSRR